MCPINYLFIAFFNFKYEIQDTSNNSTESHRIDMPEWVMYKWKPEKIDECLNKFGPIFQLFQRNIEDERQSMAALLPAFTELIQDAAEN